MSDLDALAAGGKPALARALADIEREPDAAATLALLDAAYSRPRARVVGLTGPPGVGKSTLIGALIAAWRQQGRSVGVLAVDPSSRRSGGALLGDRARIATDPADDGVFVRSLAARDRLGGLADLAMPATILLRAMFDVAVVETVGGGQSETEIAELADTVVLCVQPGSGDSLQYMKAGIAEAPDIVAVTKGDLGSMAQRAAADVRAGLGHAAPGDWSPAIEIVAAPRGQGIDTLIGEIDRHVAWLDGERLAARRAAQARHWLELAIRERFGREGLSRAGALDLAPGESPFGRLRAITKSLAR
ncbi:MAG: AAA family ATPase [Alphaproteobacteria bacterium]|nr:AAA family ATPase [Alphaproteobacteria bacterium]